MTRQGNRPLAVFVTLVFAVLLLAACGDSDSEPSGALEETPGRSTTSAQERPAERSDSGAQGKGTGEERSRGGQQDGGPQDDGAPRRGNAAAPLEVSGGGSGQFRVEGGDNSIQEYGEESDEAELREVAEIVHGFFVARVEERWDAACSYLAKPNVEQLEQLVSQSPELRNADCAQALEAFTRPVPAAIQRAVTTVDAGSFRRDGEQGFLIYYGTGRTPYAMPLRAEGGTWKVSGLSATVLG